MLPTTILSYPPPQLPNLGPPCSALCEQVMSRLSPPTVAPPALIRLQPLRARHSVPQKGARCCVARKQLVAALGNRLTHPPHRSPSEARAAEGDVAALRSDVLPDPPGGVLRPSLRGSPRQVRETCLPPDLVWCSVSLSRRRLLGHSVCYLVALYPHVGRCLITVVCGQKRCGKKYIHITFNK